MAGKVVRKNKTLLTQQTAAILEFLRENELEKAATKLQKQLEKDGFQFPQDKGEGRWKWIEEDFTSSSEEEESDSDDESESEEESSAEESEDESDVDEQKLNAKAESNNRKKDGKAAGNIESDADTERSIDQKPTGKSSETSEYPKKATIRRSVSFSDEVHERILTPHKDLKKKLFFSKSELRQFKMEAQEEKLREQMAQASAAFGITLPGIWSP